MNLIYLNGDFVAQNEAKISVNDRSYLFGEGLFETLRSHDGQFPFLKKHLQRLEWSATVLNLPFPEDINFESILSELLEKNSLKDAKFKIVLSQTQEDAPQSHLTIFCEALPAPAKSYRLKTLKAYTNDNVSLAALKSTSYLVKVLGKRDAKDSGFDDGILLNAKGLVTEATTGNLFWVDEAGVLKTVIEGQGLLRGVMRGVILDLIKEKTLVCREDMVSPLDLSNAREVFLTNAVQGIVPVVFIDGRQISGGEIGSVTAMLSDVLKQKIKTLCELQ